MAVGGFGKSLLGLVLTGPDSGEEAEWGMGCGAGAAVLFM